MFKSFFFKSQKCTSGKTFKDPSLWMFCRSSKRKAEDCLRITRINMMVAISDKKCLFASLCFLKSLFWTVRTSLNAVLGPPALWEDVRVGGRLDRAFKTQIVLPKAVWQTLKAVNWRKQKLIVKSKPRVTLDFYQLGETENLQVHIRQINIQRLVSNL